MPNHMPRAGKAVRAIRLDFATRTKDARADIARTMRDPDLKPEARERRIETAVKFIETETNRSLKAATEAVDEAKRVSRLFDPAAMRRQAVLADPGGTADLRGALAGLPELELLAFAEESFETEDDVLRFALITSIATLTPATGEVREGLGAAMAKLSKPTDPGSVSAIADHAVAVCEFAQLQFGDALAAIGKAPNLDDMVATMDAVSRSADENVTEYRLAGIDKVEPATVVHQPPLPMRAAEPVYATL